MLERDGSNPNEHVTLPLTAAHVCVRCVSAACRVPCVCAAQTILNNVDGGCVLALSLLAGVTVLSVLHCVWITHRPDYRSNKARRTHAA